jgi:hypothetical protein
MVRWKGSGPEHNKWVKHSDVFTKDAIDAYYRRYPNTPHRITSVAFDLLSFRRRERTICFIRQDTVFQGGMMSGEPLLRTVFHPDWLQTLWTVFHLALRTLLHPSI